MRAMKWLGVFGVLSIGWLPAGCATDDEGEAPAIANLTYTPLAIAVGQQSMLSGSLTFHDADADVMEMGIRVTVPSGGQQELPPTPVQNALGQIDGSVALSLALIPPEAGHYTFEIWVIDRLGNESNRLTGGADAQ